FYLLTDANEKKLQDQYQVPAAPYDIGLAIQDRLFTADGQLFYPTLPASMGAPENSIQPEFFGNIILVNGKAWPKLKVEPRPYRFRFLNGSDSRFYNLILSSGQTFTQIGTDNGFLPSPVVLQKLLLGTGERKDVIIDFSDPNLWGRTIVLHNNAKTPFPRGSTVDPKNTGRIMAFEVSLPLNTGIPKTILPTTLREPIVPLQTTLAPRKLILFETEDDYDRVTPKLGTVEEGIKDWTDPITEVIGQGDTEIWEIYNETSDAHPIHLHMVTMQLVNRQRFRASINMENGKPENIRLLGRTVPPSADEAGWKDTYISYPGEVLRVIAKFDLAGKYAWHCHILSHEDNEMMRPYLVKPATQMAITPQSMPVNEEQNLHLQVVPNPFNGTLQLRFTLDRSASVTVNVYDSKGAFVKQAYKGNDNAGQKQVAINGSEWRSGVYFCEILIGEKRAMRKLVLEK
ncbi:MAG TPA: multicopper oxidase domain-containing protein, partial [Flavisolibacter sp.]|nr:multicopper oxidase domain-containing protein [Flavisolibacter sp.]